MTSLDFVGSRRSVPARQLGAPAPNPQHLQQLLTLALRAPDHGKLTPWRLLLLQDEAKRELGRRLADLHKRKQPQLAESQWRKDSERYEHAPLVIVVIAQLQPGHEKVPVQEQLLSAGCVAYNLLLGAHALGFAAQWLTGWAAYDDDAAGLLGLGAEERVIGFVHVGTALMQVPERERPSVADKVSSWSPSSWSK